MGAGQQPGLGWLPGPVLLRPATWAADGSLWMFGGVSCIKSLDRITCAGNGIIIFLCHFETLKQQAENSNVSQVAALLLQLANQKPVACD